MTFARFSPIRLTVARQRRGLSKKTLAERVTLSPAAVTEFENGSRTPSSQTMERIASTLEFPMAFFFGEDLEPVHAALSSFRALRSMTARVRDRVLASGTIASGLITPYLNERFKLPTVDVSDLRNEHPEVAADAVRQEWKRGQAPIENVVHLLESRGVSVYWIDDPSPAVDAFSFWQNDRAFIIMNAQKASGERQRMSAAHELGHLVLHRERSIDDKRAEAEASQFGATFLMPADQFRLSCPSRPSLADLFKAKRIWGVSVAAVIRRCRDLNILTERQYVRFCQEISIQGWRRAEPHTLPHEDSLLHMRVFEKLENRQITPPHVARELNINLSDVLELMPVSRKFYQPVPQIIRKKEHLRLLA